MKWTIACLDHVQVFVKDRARSQAWYEDVLGLKRRYLKEWGESWLVLGAGKSWILLSVKESGPVASQHFAFQFKDAAYVAALKELQGKGIKVSQEDHSVSRSMYLKDPDGHRVELTAYR